MVYLMFEVAVVYSVIVACSSRCVKPPGLRKPVRVEVDKVISPPLRRTDRTYFGSGLQVDLRPHCSLRAQRLGLISFQV